MRSRWLLNVSAYTLAGAVPAAAVGALLGLAGAAVLPAQAAGPGVLVAIAVGLLALARTLGVSAIPFPQPSRQTRDVWVKRSNPTFAAIRWGFDIGLIFTTRFTFPGTWFLAIAALVAQKPALGSAMFLAYWIGRVLSVWIGPSLMRDARDTPKLLLAVQDQRLLFERTHSVALVLGAAVLGLSLGSSGPL